jgi:hypothetical protein
MSSKIIYIIVHFVWQQQYLLVFIDISADILYPKIANMEIEKFISTSIIA